MNIHRPDLDEVKHISQVSKLQLAKAVNAQTEQIKALRKNQKIMAQILIAIAAEPEAFTYADGRVAIVKSAIDKVIHGSQVRIEYTDTEVIIVAVAPADAPALVTPHVRIN